MYISCSLLNSQWTTFQCTSTPIRFISILFSHSTPVQGGTASLDSSLGDLNCQTWVKDNVQVGTARDYTAWQSCCCTMFHNVQPTADKLSVGSSTCSAIKEIWFQAYSSITPTQRCAHHVEHKTSFSTYEICSVKVSVSGTPWGLNKLSIMRYSRHWLFLKKNQNKTKTKTKTKNTTTI